MKKQQWIISVLVLGFMVVFMGCTPQPTPTPTPTPQPQDNWEDIARDLAIDRARAAGENVPVDMDWNKELVTALPGFTTWGYSCTDNGTWFIEVSYMVVLEPDFEVTINFQQFTVWEGTITYQEVTMLPR